MFELKNNIPIREDNSVVSVLKSKIKSLENEITKLKNTFDVDEELYPITIISDRYGGGYSGGTWIALKGVEGIEEISEPFLDDLTAGDYDYTDSNKMIGVGMSPNDAYFDLVRKNKKSIKRRINT